MRRWGLLVVLGATLALIAIWSVWPSRQRAGRATRSATVRFRSGGVERPTGAAPIRRVAELANENTPETAAPNVPATADSRLPMSAEAPPLLPDELEGDLVPLHERWAAEPQDVDATNRAHAWLADQLETLGLVPQTFHLACGVSLCRVGFAFDKLRDLHVLKGIRPPPDVSVQTTLPYSYPTGHMIIAYWVRPLAD
jgi:hypothetical protein